MYTRNRGSQGIKIEKILRSETCDELSRSKVFYSRIKEEFKLSTLNSIYNIIL